MDRLLEPVVSTGLEQVDNMLVDLHLSVTNGSSQAQAWTTRFTDGDANHYAISPPEIT